MRYMEWIIKPSTFCNLRCRYCYEWHGLDDSSRMPLGRWRRIADAIARYHLLLEARAGEDVRTRIIWHGGEPLALPVDYFASLLREQAAAAGRWGLPRDRVVNCVQTNLYVLQQPMLELLASHGVRIVISMDVVPGVRLSRSGHGTEAQVLRNMERLRSYGIGFGAITVLAKHTCPVVRDVYDFWASWGADVRFLPLFAGPEGRETARFEVSEAELVQALGDLFEHWLDVNAKIKVAPLDEWIIAVIRQMLGIEAERYDRRRDGESVLVVRPDGDVYQTNELGNAELALGNLATDDLKGVLAGRPYATSLDRSDALAASVCGGCEYRTGCDGYPAHAEAFAWHGPRRCPVAFGVYRRIEAAIRHRGFGIAELRGIAQGLADAAAPA